MKRIIFTISMLILAILAVTAQADYLGSWTIDATLPVFVTTHRFSSGAAYAASPITLKVYEDACDVELTIADANMSQFDSITGLYEKTLTLSAANGYEKGKSYTVLIQATVDSVSAIATHNFQINAAVDVNTILGEVPIGEDRFDNIDADIATANTKITTILADVEDVNVTVDDILVAVGTVQTQIEDVNAALNADLDSLLVAVEDVNVATGTTLPVQIEDINAVTLTVIEDINAVTLAAVAAIQSQIEDINAVTYAQIEDVNITAKATLEDTSAADTSSELKTLIFGVDQNGVTANVWTSTKAGYLDMPISDITVSIDVNDIVDKSLSGHDTQGTLSWYLKAIRTIR